MNNFSYFPWWGQLLVFTFLFVFAIPAVNNSFKLFIGKLFSNLNKETTGKSKKIIWFTCISLCISLLFYLFRVKFDLLGDTNLRVSQSVEGSYISDEYLTMYIMHYVCNISHTLFHFTPHQTFVVASVSAGFIFSLLGLLIASLLFEDTFSVAVFYLFYISIGTILVFCGYVEIYAIPAVSASLYIYSALLFLKKKVNILFPFFCLVLAVLLHKEQVSLLPSLVFLATKKLKVINKINGKIILGLFAVSIPLIYNINSFYHLQELMPLAKDKQFPQLNTLFSPSYWWELFNSQYISSGILLFLFVWILFKILKEQIKLDEYSKFFLIATLFIYSIIITMNKMRGSGDWDVCSFPAIYLTMFIAYIALTQWKRIYSPRKGFYILSTAVLLNIVSCWAWIGINSGKKSLNKIEDMLLTDPGWYYQVRLPAEMELCHIFEICGSDEKALKYYKISYEKYGGTRLNAVTNYIAFFMNKKDTDRAVPVMESMLTTYPFFFHNYTHLFQIYNKRKLYNKTYKLAKVFIATYNSKPDTVLDDVISKKMLGICINYLYGYSIIKKDTATTRDMLIKMKQLNIKVPES